MRIRKMYGRNLHFRAGILILIGILVFMLTGCESIFGPKTEEEEEDEDEEARIIVYNEYMQTLDIYMDGTFQFAVEDGDSDKISDVSLDEHELEAKLAGTGTVVDSETMDVTDYVDYSWTIDDPPDIKVINQYGKALKIYMDGEYKFDIADEENRWIMDVPMGEHFLKAYLVSNNEQVASITLSIDENKDYEWTIQ